MGNYNNFYYDPYYGNFTYNTDEQFWSWSTCGNYSFNYSNVGGYAHRGTEEFYYRVIDNSFWCEDKGPYWYLQCDPYSKEFNKSRNDTEVLPPPPSDTYYECSY